MHRTFLNGSSTRFLTYPKPPFDFKRSAGIHGRFKKSLPDIYENDSYKRVLHVDEKPVLVTVSSKGTTERPKLLVEVHPRLRNLGIKSLRKLLHSMFAPSFDFNRFCKLAKKDRLMTDVAKKLRGLRPISPPTIFEAVVIAVTEQQISLDAAIAIRSRMIEKYGDKVVLDGRPFYAFPNSRSLAKAKPKEMRSVGLSVGKAQYISELSKKVERGELDLERLREMNDEEAVTELTKIKGIGRWSAEYVLIRGMGRLNSLPADDLGIQRVVSQAYFKKKRISSDEVRCILGKFDPYSGIAAFYLMYYLFWEPRQAE